MKVLFAWFVLYVVDHWKIIVFSFFSSYGLIWLWQKKKETFPCVGPVLMKPMWFLYEKSFSLRDEVMTQPKGLIWFISKVCKGLKFWITEELSVWITLVTVFCASQVIVVFEKNPFWKTSEILTFIIHSVDLFAIVVVMILFTIWIIWIFNDGIPRISKWVMWYVHENTFSIVFVVAVLSILLFWNYSGNMFVWIHNDGPMHMWESLLSFLVPLVAETFIVTALILFVTVCVVAFVFGIWTILSDNRKERVRESVINAIRFCVSINEKCTVSINLPKK